MQDHEKGGFIVDEKAIWPLALAEEVQQAGEVPVTTPFAYPAGTLTLAPTNGDPTGAPARVTLVDKATGDPTDTSGAPPSAASAKAGGSRCSPSRSWWRAALRPPRSSRRAICRSSTSTATSLPP